MRAVDEGVGLRQDLFDAVEWRGIEVWYDAPAVVLLTSGSSVTGVRVRKRGVSEYPHSADDSPGEDIDVSGVVILASGGFEASPEMRRCYLGQGWDLVKVRGSPSTWARCWSARSKPARTPPGHWGVSRQPAGRRLCGRR